MARKPKGKSKRQKKKQQKKQEQRKRQSLYNQNRSYIEKSGFSTKQINPYLSEQEVKRQIKNAKQRQRYYKKKNQIESLGFSGKDVNRIMRMNKKEYESFLKDNAGQMYLIAGVRDVTERGEMDGYIEEVFNLGRNTLSKDLNAAILDALTNPNMQSVGMIGKSYIYVAANEKEAKDYLNYCDRNEIEVVYRGQGKYLKSLKIAINIAMSLLYYIDERDAFIQDFIEGLKQLDNERARKNADILYNEFILGG